MLKQQMVHNVNPCFEEAVERYTEGHASHSNRIVTTETAVRQLWVHLVCAVHIASEKRMSTLSRLCSNL